MYSLEDTEAEPAPVHAMPLYQAVAVQLHGLDEIHLIQ